MQLHVRGMRAEALFLSVFDTLTGLTMLIDLVSLSLVPIFRTTRSYNARNYINSLERHTQNSLN